MGQWLEWGILQYSQYAGMSSNPHEDKLPFQKSLTNKCMYIACVCKSLCIESCMCIFASLKKIYL